MSLIDYSIISWYAATSPSSSRCNRAELDKPRPALEGESAKSLMEASTKCCNDMIKETQGH